uniref:DUF4168 domain-containing protein n=1 Tax=Panagrellus redivivus TaxID=6233 RepID=A0A7E4UZY6_PANRE
MLNRVSDAKTLRNRRCLNLAAISLSILPLRHAQTVLLPQIEKFYQEQISQTVVEPQVKQPPPDPRLKEATSFEDYMKRMKEDDKEKTEEDKNPQIEVNSDEEVLFDSDEEPEYLSKVMDKAVEDYEKADIEDINIRLMKAGVASLVDDEDEQMDKLYNLLNDEEKKTFTRLAEQMHYDEVGISQSCFKKRENE